MAVLKNLRRVLVRATLSRTTTSTAIADVAMDTVTELSPGFTPAKEIEVRKINQILKNFQYKIVLKIISRKIKFCIV